MSFTREALPGESWGVGWTSQAIQFGNRYPVPLPGHYLFELFVTRAPCRSSISALGRRATDVSNHGGLINFCAMELILRLSVVIEPYHEPDHGEIGARRSRHALIPARFRAFFGLAGTGFQSCHLASEKKPTLSGSEKTPLILRFAFCLR